MSSSAVIKPHLRPDIFESSCKTASSAIPTELAHPFFEPARHLKCVKPNGDLTMSDIGLQPTAISAVAATQPLPLLSREAILEMRREIFSHQVLENCMYHTHPGSVQIRGLAPHYAPFIHALWNSPEVLKIISANAGIDLIPCFDYEISHVNVQLGPGGVDAVHNTPIEPPEATLSTTMHPVVEWHKDSYPFVCVVMLSHTHYMTGGSTELKCGNNSTLEIKAPQFGYATILQGRHIMHTANPATNMAERITLITSFRPRDPSLPDESNLANIREDSRLPELYFQWTAYRLEVLAQRALMAKRKLERRYRENVARVEAEGREGVCRGQTIGVDEVGCWCKEQIAYMRVTMHEMRPLEGEQSEIDKGIKVD